MESTGITIGIVLIGIIIGYLILVFFQKGGLRNPRVAISVGAVFLLSSWILGTSQNFSQSSLTILLIGIGFVVLGIVGLYKNHKASK